MTFTRTDTDVSWLDLTLYDGTSRPYLLDDPRTAEVTAVPPGAVYEPRVQAAFILAGQGYDARWLARFAELPLTAARCIAQAAGSAA
jgi:hypothetical protein